MITGLQILIDGASQPTTQQWLLLIEARRKMMGTYLDRFTLRQLGSLACLKGCTGPHAIQDNDPQVVAGQAGLSLQTQGLFWPQPRTKRYKNPDRGYYPVHHRFEVPSGFLQVWGLTRSNVWILAAVHFEGEAGDENLGYERATRVEIRPATLTEIIALTEEKPPEMWKALGKEIQAWRDRYKSLFEMANRLANDVATEEEILALLSV